MYGVGNETLMRLQKCAFSALGDTSSRTAGFFPFFSPFSFFFFLMLLHTILCLSGMHCLPLHMHVFFTLQAPLEHVVLFSFVG